MQFHALKYCVIHWRGVVHQETESLSGSWSLKRLKWHENSKVKSTSILQMRPNSQRFLLSANFSDNFDCLPKDKSSAKLWMNRSFAGQPTQHSSSSRLPAIISIRFWFVCCFFVSFFLRKNGKVMRDRNGWMKHKPPTFITCECIHSPEFKPNPIPISNCISISPMQIGEMVTGFEWVYQRVCFNALAPARSIDFQMENYEWTSNKFHWKHLPIRLTEHSRLNARAA